MGTLYLKLSLHIYDRVLGAILGLSIDEGPSQRAQDIAAAEEVSATDQVRRNITLSSLQKGLACLKIKTPDNRVETVVLTIEAYEDLANPINTLNIELSLTQHSMLEIKAMSPRASLVLVTPKLALLATGTTDRCQALLADASQCRFQKVNWRWCPFHTDQHVFLHDDSLKKLKPWFEAVKGSFVYMRGINDGIGMYNNIQESLALRIIITQVLYAGDEDDNHRKFARTTRQNRSNVASQLAKDGSDGSGRVTIYTQIERFVVEAREREAKPAARECWYDELTVNLNDVRDVQTHGGPDPSVYRLYTNPGALEMDDNFRMKVNEYDNLPVIVPLPRRNIKPLWEMTPAELRIEWPKRCGDKKLPFPTPKDLADMKMDAQIQAKEGKDEPLTAEEQARVDEVAAIWLALGS